MYQFMNYAELFKPEEVIDYLRKSRADDPTLTVEEVLQNHEIDLDNWAERNLGAKVPEENKFYEVVSGEKISERPEFNKVLKLIENPRYKAIKCYDVSRLSRGDLEDAGRLIKLLRYTQTYVITVNPQYVYDLTNADDREKFERELKRGNEYLEYFKKISNNGRLLSVSQGNYIGSVAPYGFNKITVMDGKRKCPTLEENKEEADVVRLIFDLYVNKDMGRTNICNYLDYMGIKPPKGEHWSPAALKDKLENVHYIGKVKWNWRKTLTIVEDSEIIQTRPKAKIGEYLIYEGRHEGIVSEELFYAAREKQGRNHRAKATTKVRNPLAGLLWCKCGRTMSLRFYKNKDGTEKSAPRLSCEGQKHCNSGSCLYDEIIDRVKEVLQQCIAEFEIRIKNGEGDSAKLHNKLIKNLEKKKAELEARELAQWEQQSHPDLAQRMPPEIFKKLNEKLLKEKEEVRQALCKAYESMPEPINYEEQLKRFKDALTTLKNPKADAAIKNKLLKACIERIEYSRERPKRMTREDAEKQGIPLQVGGKWSDPPIELDVKLRV
jgi:DNA invertase Pin-like site-specific DNA recombinase